MGLMRSGKGERKGMEREGELDGRRRRGECRVEDQEGVMNGRERGVGGIGTKVEHTLSRRHGSAVALSARGGRKRQSSCTVRLDEFHLPISFGPSELLQDWQHARFLTLPRD